VIPIRERVAAIFRFNPWSRRRRVLEAAPVRREIINSPFPSGNG
jgi:hypothetical protein